MTSVDELVVPGPSDHVLSIRRPEWLRKPIILAHTDGSAATFWNEALPWARQVHATLPQLFISFILAQWAEETGYGGYDWAVAHNPGNVGSFDGQPLNTFPNLAEGVQAYEQCMTNGYYKAVLAAKTWQAQCYALGNSPWASAHYEASGPPPGEDLIKITNSFNLTQYNGSSPTPGPSPTPSPSPTPTPATTTGENMLCYDPGNPGGSWALYDDGGVEGDGPSPFLGSLAGNRFNWKDIGVLAGIAPWYDGSGWGFKIAIKTGSPTGGEGGGAFDYYRFPSNGSLAKTTADGSFVATTRWEETDEGIAYLARTN